MPPRFVSSGAMAGNAIQEFLIRRAMEERQAQMDALMQQRQQAEEEDRKRRLGLEEREFNERTERQRRVDAQAEDERQAGKRQQANVAGVRGMMADAMTQGPLTPDSAKTIGIMAFREGMEPPDEVTRMLEPDTSGRELADYEAKKMIDASIAAQGRTASPWRSAGQGIIYNEETGAFRQAPEAGAGGGARGSGGDASQDYALGTADRVIEAIDGVLPKINERTAGIVGSATTRLGINQEGIDVQRELQTVAGNIAFNALQQMRNASKTGGALGSVAQQELQLLQSVEGSLAQDQSPANLKAQLAKVRASMERFKAAQAQLGAGRGASGGPGGGGSFRVIGSRPAR